MLGGYPAAETSCRKADLILALGCSMTVTPACDLPRLKPAGAVLVIVNLQETQADADAGVRVFFPCDQFFSQLMAELHGGSGGG